MAISIGPFSASTYEIKNYFSFLVFTHNITKEKKEPKSILTA